MSERLTASRWVASRGEKWAAHLSGMEAMLAPVDEPLIEALRLDRPLRIADLGCGGGATSIEIFRRAPAGSVVHGIDIAPRLVEIARHGLTSRAREIAFDLADISVAQPARPYDRLASRFGVMFFEHPYAAFANLSRWLERGGRFAFAVWGPQPENAWMTIVRDAVAGVVDVPIAAPDAPGPFRYSDGHALRALLDRVGFAELDVRDWKGALTIGRGLAPADAARFALASFGSFSELLERAGDDAVREVHRSLTRRFSDHY
jgi:SAM-dependent methyltransferase